MKTYIIILSEQFPTTHQRKGQETNFKRLFLNGKKIHTIRRDFYRWKKIISQVQGGEAVLSIRQWTEKPYRSKQVEIGRLTAQDGVGIQKGGLHTDKSPTLSANAQEQNNLVVAMKDDSIMQINPSHESGGTQPYQQNRVYDTGGQAPALMSGHGGRTFNVLTGGGAKVR